MHEMQIANDLVNKAKQYGEVISVSIEVGDLAHLTVEELDEALKKLVKWKIKIKKTPAKIECNCGYKGKPKILEQRHGFTLYACPKCSFSMPKILEGGDIILKEVKVK